MTVALNAVGATPATQQYVPSVSSSGNGGLLSAAVALSSESAIVASLGGSSGVTVYTPSGLLDSLRQAGTLAEPVSLPLPGSVTGTTAGQLLDQAIVGTLASSSSASGIYDGSGTLQGLPSAEASANWADILKNQPELASTVIAASFNAGLVGTLLAMA